MAGTSSSGSVDKLFFDKHGSQDGDDRDNSTKRELRKLEDRLHRMVQINSTKRKGADAPLHLTRGGLKTIQACVTGFTHFITSNAEQRCNAEKRGMVTGDDVLCAMDTTGFVHYMEYLNQWLRKDRPGEKRDDKGSGQSSSTKEEGGEEEGGTAAEFIAPEYIPPPTLSADGKWEPKNSTVPRNVVHSATAAEIEDLEVLWTPWVSKSIGRDSDLFMSLNRERLLAPPPGFDPASSAFDTTRAPQ